VSEGHPDKVCDYIADSILDAYLTADAHSRVACEVLCKCNLVVVAGEITSRARIDYEHVVREAIGQIGYTDPAEPFSAESVQILLAMTRAAQSNREEVVRIPVRKLEGQVASRDAI
jgi:S-adenosylmethionine synthetase